jgi:hypothetical protein
MASRRVTRLGRMHTALAATAAGALLASFVIAPTLRAHASTLALCNNAGPAQGIQHVIVVMLENESTDQVVGNTTDAPYVNGTLTKQCGYATQMYGATHWSAANYLAVTGGQYPAGSSAGCGSVGACDTAADNVFHQTAAAGLSWKSYQESMPGPCYKSSSGSYSLGHNPVPFYTNLGSDCAQLDVPVADLTAQSGPFWNDLQNRTLPSYSFVTPNDIDNGHDDGTGVPAIDDFLSEFVPLIQNSNTYQDGNTAVFVTFDEGYGGSQGQDCTDQAKDLAGDQESCHIPFFVISPYTKPGPVSGFFDHYSLTRTVEELFNLPLLGGAATAPSLVTPFGLTASSSTPSPTASPTASPTPTTSPSPSPTASATPSSSPTGSPSPSNTTSAPPREYVTNPGFEDGTDDGWGGIYTSTTDSAPTQTDSYAGAWSLGISSTASTDGPVGITSKPPIIASATADTVLSSSVMVRATVPGVNLRLMIWETDADGNRVGYSVRSITLNDTAWHRARLINPYTVQATGDTIWCSLYSKSLPAGASIYADNFSVTSPS